MGFSFFHLLIAAPPLLSAMAVFSGFVGPSAPLLLSVASGLLLLVA